jgi:cytosolic carboxypeptidase protein 5
VEGGSTRSWIFNKPVIFLSARVHPGEVPSSHVLNGLIKYLLLENDESAKRLRDNFVFKIIPCLNPDGVYRGYFRNDTCNQNLNRYYKNPDPTLQPTIFAAKQVVTQLNQRLTQKSIDNNPASQLGLIYIDLHAHAVR